VSSTNQSTYDWSGRASHPQSVKLTVGAATASSRSPAPPRVRSVFAPIPCLTITTTTGPFAAAWANVGVRIGRRVDHPDQPGRRPTVGRCRAVDEGPKGWRARTGSRAHRTRPTPITTRHFTPRVRAFGSFAAPSPSFPTRKSWERETSGQRQAKDPGQPAGGGPAHQAPGPASPAGRGTHRGGRGQRAGHEGARTAATDHPPRATESTTHQRSSTEHTHPPRKTPAGATGRAHSQGGPANGRRKGTRPANRRPRSPTWRRRGGVAGTPAQPRCRGAHGRTGRGVVGW
jgi:hypothetical protein